MTVNFQQVNNPFTLGQVSGTANLGVSVGDIEELYELLGYTESQDLASQLVSAAGFSMIGAAPEVIKSVKHKDDVRAAYKIATSVTNNKFEQFNLSNRFEDLLIGETESFNKAIKDSSEGNWFSKLFKSVTRDGSSPTNVGSLPNSKAKTAGGTPSPTSKSQTKMATEGTIHSSLKITKNSAGTVEVAGLSDKVKNNMETITQKLAETAGEEDLTPYNSLNDLKKIDKDTITNGAETAATKAKSILSGDVAENIGKAASSSVSNIKSVTKSVAKEAFSGPCIAITAITGLATELPEIMNAFQTSSSEGWSQLGKSALTIAISDVGMSAAGQILGGTIGFALGGLLGPVGASIGGAIGKAVGSSLGSVIGRKLSSWIFGKSTSEKQQEEQLKEQAQTAASSQTDLQTLLAQAKEQATQETDSKKAQKILAQVQVIENKLAKNTSTTTQSSYTNPFVLAS